MALNMQPFQHFDPDSETATVSQRWKKWKSIFENFLVANNITNNTRKRALLLHHAGERVYDIFKTLEDTGESNDYNAAIEKLTEYFSPQKSKPSMRLERWALRLQPYNLKVKYQPGETNAADYLSRYALTKTSRSTKNNEIEMYVNSIITDAIPKEMTLSEIQEATTKDSDLQVLQSFSETTKKEENIDAPYDNEIYEIISINGSMITARSDNSTVTRNSSFFKLVR